MAILASLVCFATAPVAFAQPPWSGDDPRCAGLAQRLDDAARLALVRVVHVTSDAELIAGCSFVRELDDATLRLFQAGKVESAIGDGRRWMRFPCNVETACYALDTTPGERSPARTVNISAGGAALLLPCEFGAGTLLKLDLEGTAARAAGEVLLRVVRAAARPGGDWFIGCEFADQISGAEAKALL